LKIQVPVTIVGASGANGLKVALEGPYEGMFATLSGVSSSLIVGDKVCDIVWTNVAAKTTWV